MVDFLKTILSAFGFGGHAQQVPPEAGPQQGPQDAPHAQGQPPPGASRISRYTWVRDEHGQPGAPLPSESEVWQSASHGLTIGKCTTRYITASGRVASAEELRSVCQFPGCGEYEAEVLICFTCGLTYCGRHAKAIELDNELRTYCDVHLEEELRNFNLWEAADKARGLPPSISGKPPRPRAPNPFQQRLNAQTKPSILAPVWRHESDGRSGQAH
jgi:hypothetical protein